jgi:peroxiredoxin
MQNKQPEWARMTLAIAAIFHVLWGLLAVVYPSFVFRLTGTPLPEPLLYWQALGICSLALAVGLSVAAREPARHWPIVLMALVFALLNTIGAGMAYLQGSLPLSFGALLLLHDIIWIGPFAWILVEAHHLVTDRQRRSSPEVRRLSLRIRTSEGVSLEEMSRRSPTMLVFLRHFRCPFCREALTELAALRAEIEKSGTRIAFVHMRGDAEARDLFSKYGLGDLPRISDPSCVLYRAFGLAKGSFGQVFGIKAWLRGFKTGILQGHGIGGWFDDLFQMPGVFLLFHGEVLNSYLHQSIADRPDYLRILEPHCVDDVGLSVQ